MKREFLTSLSLIALAALPSPAAAQEGALPDQFELGRNAQGNPCTASRYWNDAGVPDPFATSYSFTCRGATANRFLGVVRLVKTRDLEPIDRTVECGTPTAITLPGVGAGSSRRCFDRTLGLETVETRIPQGRFTYVASASAIAQGPAEEALMIMARAKPSNLDRGRSTTAVIDAAALAPAPAGTSASAAAVADAESAIQSSLRLVRQGLHLEASRTLTDALGRLPADATPSVRIELLLLAGLADSNLRFFDSANDYFTRADQLLAANPDVPGAAVLQRKRRNYAALDLLNRRDFTNAVSALEQLAQVQTEPDQPLLDPTTVRALNQTAQADPAAKGARATDFSEVVSVPDEGAMSQLVIDTQAHWARSIALLGQNRPQEALSALQEADRSFALLREAKIRQQQLLWLSARIERQRARLLLRLNDRDGALKALDVAIDNLRLAEERGDRGPALAQTQLERAAVLSRGGASAEQVLQQFDDALTTLVSSDTASTQLSPLTANYLDLLVAEAARNPQGPSHERFFKAMQAASNPAVARQFVELQSQVTADPALASKVQDQQEIEREIIRIRFEIAEKGNADAEEVATLEGRKTELENQLVAIANELASNQSYVQVADEPVTVDQIRQALNPGEAYFKLTRVGAYVFGLLADEQGTQIYRVALPAVDLDPLIGCVRDSISGAAALPADYSGPRSGCGREAAGDPTKLAPFDVATANALYQLLAGPVNARLTAAQSLVVDVSGVLDKLPLGVLVTDRASVERFAQVRRTDAYDYTGVNFLARLVSISTALSPRSLIVSRGLAPSQAPYPFIGFAQHMPVETVARGGGALISVGTACEVELGAIAELTRELAPIDARELKLAGAALGLQNVPEVTGAEFTDTAIRARSDLNQFQVLHFATHGITEGQWACAKAPPALVTSFGGSGSDAILSYNEVARLRLDANLVVLSACDTAAGTSIGSARATGGNEEVSASLDGLVRAFMAANARAVLSTYWPISDAGESEALIADFYRNARQGTIGEALKAAQTALIASRDSSHPLFWAPFFLVGDAQKPLLTGQARVAITSPATSDRAPQGELALNR